MVVLPNQTSISTRVYLQYASLRMVVVIRESSAATHIHASKERQQVSWTFLLSRPRRLMVKKMAALPRASILPSVKTELRRKSSRRSRKTFRWFLDQGKPMIDDGGTSSCFCPHVDRRSCYSE